MPCHSDDAVFYNASDPSKQPTNNETFTRNLDRLLQSMYLTFPRTYINLVMLPEHFDPHITTTHFTCKLFKWYSKLTHIHWTATSEWIAAIKEYNGIMLDVAARWKAKQLKDFAVVPQPFMRAAPLTIADMDTLDCFHPNLQSHRGMAVALWNNMLAASVSEKSTNFKSQQVATCPSEDARLLV